MKKIFTAISIITCILYVFALYYMLFLISGRQMVITSADMLDDYNYWNSVSLIPFKTITQYVSELINGSSRGHAIRNLIGNLFLFFPAGFFLPFFLRKMNKLKSYSAAMALLIITVELAQVVTMTGSFDIDDFILNLAGAIAGFIVFTRTPVRTLFKLRAW